MRTGTRTVPYTGAPTGQEKIVRFSDTEARRRAPLAFGCLRRGHVYDMLVPRKTKSFERTTSPVNVLCLSRVFLISLSHAYSCIRRYTPHLHCLVPTLHCVCGEVSTLVIPSACTTARMLYVFHPYFCSLHWKRNQFKFAQSKISLKGL